MKRRALVATSILGLASLAAISRGAKVAQKGAHIRYPDIVSEGSLVFPRDHGAHPDFRTEWWYLTGWLQMSDGSPLGFQVTFFRTRPDVASGNPSAFAPHQLLFAHAALSDPKVGHLIGAQCAARAGMGLAGAKEGDAQVFIGRWSLARDRASGKWDTQIDSKQFNLDLQCMLTTAILEEGIRGFSQKGPSPLQASRYYSLPQLTVSGQLTRDGTTAPVHGSAWLDHEWSSSYLDARAVGWDWTGLNFDDGGALMAFRIRLASGDSLWAGATWRGANGQLKQFGPSDVTFHVRRVWRSPRTGVSYPIEQRLQIGGNVWHLEPLFDDQEFDGEASTGTLYWEGAVRAQLQPAATGASSNAPPQASARGYLELTGYDRALKL